ncbi:MAG TPA: Uma2 family endonuclease [Urbifossiella sp.]|nr:Uma2 family endonuclease [Urbifossiella sp.]
MVTATNLRPTFLPEYTGAYRFTVDEYHRLAEIGVLDWQEALELIDGYVMHKGGRTPSPLRPATPPEWCTLRRFTVPEYHAMLDAGILTSGDPVELIDGYLVQKMSRNPPHDAAIDLFRAALAPLTRPGTLLRSQQAVTLQDGEPEPDFALVRGTPRSFAQQHPRPGQIILVAEVADSSLAMDRGLKAVAYARNALPVYWIINIEDRHVEVYTDPDPAATPPAYRTRTDYAPGQDVPLVLDGATVGSIPAAELLP